MLLSTLKDLAYSFVNLAYPPLCIHCGEDIYEHGQYICRLCFEQLEEIDPSQLCPRCFSKKYHLTSKVCYDCQKNPCLFTKSASAFEYLGPAGTIIKKMKYGEMPYLAKGAAAYMVRQMFRLDWPIPDVVVPVPLSFSHKIKRGYNQSELLGEEIANMISCNLINALVRKKGGYSQAALRRDQREKMATNTFQIKKNVDVVEKRVLLVDDVYTTGSTLRRCAEALCDGYPAEIYAMTFCRAL
jgi:ComF family protein